MVKIQFSQDSEIKDGSMMTLVDADEKEMATISFETYDLFQSI